MHQKWKQEQELRRRKAAEQDSSSSSKGGKESRRKQHDGQHETTDLTSPLKLIVKLLRFAIMATAVAMVSGFFVAGDPLWGYRGKYTKLRTYLPVSCSEISPDFQYQWFAIHES